MSQPSIPGMLLAHARQLARSEASSGLYAKDGNPTPSLPQGAEAFATVRGCAQLAANLFTPRASENQKG